MKYVFRVVLCLIFFCKIVGGSVYVRKLIDSFANPSLCSSLNYLSSADCDLRSAWEYCKSIYPQGKLCTIQLPGSAISFGKYGPLSAVSGPSVIKIAINGSGTSIVSDGTSHQFLFLTSGSTSSSKNLVISINSIKLSKFNNHTVNGGAVYINGLSGISFVNVTFSYNTALSGGAIYMTQSSYIYISKCSFLNNIAISNGGAITIYSNSNNLYVTDTGLSGNYAGDSGGALVAYSSVRNIVVQRSTFSNNRAQNYGGSVYFYENISNVTLSGSTFSSSTAEYGGAVCLYTSSSNVYFTNCVFKLNTASLYGGAVYMYSSNANIYFTSNCMFISNQAVSDGGAVYLSSNNNYVYLVNSVFQSNMAQDGALLYAFTLNNYIYLTNSNVHNHVATIGAGLVLHSLNQYVTVSNCTFFNNTAAQGVCVYSEQDSNYLTVQHSLFKYNTAALRGGAIALVLYSNYISIVNNTFRGNYAGALGGALYIGDSLTQSTVEYNTFSSNSVGLYGGAVAIVQSNQNIAFTQNSFTSNSANSGGALFLNFGNMDIAVSSCRFHSNSAGLSGAAIYMNLDNIVTLSYSSFLNNAASINGGAVAFELLNSVLITDTNFSGNSASSGGALYFAGEHKSVRVGGGTFTGNAATGSGSCGGGIAFRGSASANVSFVNVDFQSNSATASGSTGGGICLTSTQDVTLRALTFRGNNAMQGGAVSMNSVTVAVLSDCLFDSNVATEGGGMYVYRSSSVVCKGSLFRRNTAYGSGSAIYYYHVLPASLLNNTFTSNVAAAGGAVYLDDSGAVSYPVGLQINNTYAENSAAYGPDWATGIKKVNSTNTIEMVRHYDLIAGLELYLLDQFGQVVNTSQSTYFSGAMRGSQCHGYSAYLLGSALVHVTTAETAVTSFKARCYPGGNTTLFMISSSSTSLSTTTSLYFPKCQRGDYYSDQKCIQCPVGYYSLEDNADNSVTSCKTCPDAANNCVGDNIILSAGTWRVSDLAETIFDCPYGSTACVGGNTTGNSSCETGYKGPLCSVCDTDYFLSASSTACSKCGSYNRLEITLLIALSCGIPAFLLLIVVATRREKKDSGKSEGLYNLLFDRCLRALSNFDIQEALNEEVAVNREERQEQDQGGGGESGQGTNRTEEGQAVQAGSNTVVVSTAESLRLQLLLIVGKIKILVAVFQITSSFPQSLNIKLPSPASGLMGYLSFLSLSLVQVVPLACVDPNVDYIDGVVFTTLAPMGIAAFIFLLFLIRYIHIIFGDYGDMGTEQRMKEIQRRKYLTASRFFALFLLLTFLVLPGVTTTIVGSFQCTDLDPDSVMDSAQVYLEYNFGVYWASAMCLVYPIGIPAMYFYLLYRNSERILSLKDSDDSASSPDYSGSIFDGVAAIAFLYRAYKPEYWYWELVETSRRLFFTAVISIISKESSTQIVTGIIAAIFYTKLYAYFQPFKEWDNNLLQELSEYQILFTLLGCLMVNYNALDNFSWGSYFISYSMLFINLVILFATLYVSLVMVEEVEENMCEEAKGNHNPTPTLVRGDPCIHGQSGHMNSVQNISRSDGPSSPLFKPTTMTREHGHDEITQDGCVKVHGGDHEEEKREDIELLSVEGELFSAPVVYPPDKYSDPGQSTSAASRRNVPRVRSVPESSSRANEEGNSSSLLQRMKVEFRLVRGDKSLQSGSARRTAQEGDAEEDRMLQMYLHDNRDEV